MAAFDQQDFDRFMNQARVELLGSSDAGIKAALFDVLHEFFNDTSAWTESIPVTIQPNTLTYQLTPADSGQIIKLAGVLDTNQVPVPAVMPDFGVLSLKWGVQNQTTYTVVVVKNVALPTTRDAVPLAPAWVLQVYAPYILAGVLGKMMAQPNKSYTSETSSTYNLRKFRDGIAVARADALRRNTFGTQAWSFPQSYASRGQRGGVSTANPTRFGNG